MGEESAAQAEGGPRNNDALRKREVATAMPWCGAIVQSEISERSWDRSNANSGESVALILTTSARLSMSSTLRTNASRAPCADARAINSVVVDAENQGI